MAWIRLTLRRLRDDRVPTAGLVVLILVTAFVAGLAPRLLARLADDALRTEVAGAPPAARNLQLFQQQIIDPGPDADPLAEVDAAGAELALTVPAAIRRLVVRRDAVIESGRFRIQKATTDPAFVRLRIQEGIADHVGYVEGRPPTAIVETRDAVGPNALNGVPVYEAAVSRLTATRFGLDLGETLTLVGDPGDALIGRTPVDVYAFARITGIYEVPDPASDYWLDDPLLIHPVIRALSAEVQLLDAALLLDEHTYAALVRNTQALGRPLRYTCRMFLAADRLTARALPGLIVGARRLKVAYPSANVTPASDTALRTGMLQLLEGHQARWVAAESIFAVVALGPVLVAVATLALIAILAGRRRRATMTLARSRGASTRQVLGPVLVEGLLLAVPAAAVATLVSVLAVPAGRLSFTLVAVAVTVGVALGVLLGTVLPVVGAPGLQRRPGDRIVTGRVAGRRLVFEVLIVALAAAAAYLLRERGVRAVGSGADLVAFDPLIAAVPALTGVAAGIVAVRLYPFALRVVAWLGRRRRGLIPMLAARRAMEGGISAAVLLVLLATATVGAFSAAALDNLDRGADIASWQEVGGAYRMQEPSAPLPGGFDASTLPGVEVAATEFQASYPLGLSGPQTLFAAVEAGPLAAVLAGSPADPAFPDGFTTPGTGPIPAIVSRSLVENPRGVSPGDVFQMSVQGFTLQYRAVAVRDSFPGLPLDRPFVVVPREWFSAQAPAARIVPTVAIVRAPASAAAALREAVASRAPTMTVISQAETAAALRASPVTNAVRLGILAAALVTAGYAALGVAAALALAGLARGQEVAHLRTLGLTARQGFALLVAEHGPTTAAAFAAGGGLGAGLFLLLRDGLGLADLVGSPVDVPLVIEAGPLVLILVTLTVVVAAGLALGTLLQRRVAPSAAIRGRFE